MQQISQILPLALKPTELQVQESKQPRTSEETQLEKAIQAPRLCNSPLEELKQALRYAFIMVGLRAQNFPVDEEKAVLMEYIIENYGGHTAEEVKLAFKMAIQGKLKIDPKDVKCYENFSVLYFTTIMEAYRAWSTEQVRLLTPPPAPKIPNAKELAQIDMEYAYFLLKLINKLPYKI